MGKIESGAGGEPVKTWDDLAEGFGQQASKLGPAHLAKSDSSPYNPTASEQPGAKTRITLYKRLLARLGISVQDHIMMPDPEKSEEKRL